MLHGRHVLAMHGVMSWPAIVRPLSSQPSQPAKDHQQFVSCQPPHAEIQACTHAHTGTHTPRETSTCQPPPHPPCYTALCHYSLFRCTALCELQVEHVMLLCCHHAAPQACGLAALLHCGSAVASAPAPGHQAAGSEGAALGGAAYTIPATGGDTARRGGMRGSIARSGAAL